MELKVHVYKLRITATLQLQNVLFETWTYPWFK